MLRRNVAKSRSRSRPGPTHSQCIKFKTHSSIVLNRFENLNHRLLTLMASPTARPSPPTLGSAHDVDLADVSMSVDRQGTPGPGGEHNTISARQSAGGAGGGVGKKKKGKGKK